MTRYWYGACLVVALAGVGVSAGEPPGSTRFTISNRSVLASERRLDKRISLLEGRITLGETLERIGAETGVLLEADDRVAPISGYVLTAAIHQRPAREALEAMAALFHVPPDRWYWRRERRHGKTRFVLRNTLPAQAAGRQREEFAHRFRVEQQQQMRRFYAAAPAERERMARENPFLAALHHPGNFERNRIISSFVLPLPETTLREIASGRDLKIPVSELNPEQQQFVRSELDRSAGRVEVMGARKESQQSVTLHYSQDGTIYLFIPGRGGPGALGGIWYDQAEREHGVQEWLGAGEDTRAPEGIIPAPGEKATPEELGIRRQTLDAILLRLGRLGRLNVLFDAPPNVFTSRSSPGFGLQGSVGEVLANLGRQHLIWKRRGSFILFRRPDWPKARLHPVVPWPLLRDLRASAAAHEGYLQPELWLRMAHLHRDQLETLAEEFPDAGQVRRYQTLLRLVDGMSPRERALLARPQGAGWADLSQNTRSRVLVLLPREEALGARLLLQWEKEARPPLVRLFFSPADQFRPVEVPFQARREEERPSDRPPSG